MRVLLVAAALLASSIAFVPGATAVGECIGDPVTVQACQNFTHPGLTHCASLTAARQSASLCSGVMGTEVCTDVNEARDCIPVS